MNGRRTVPPNDSEQEVNRIIAELDGLESSREEPDLSRLEGYARHLNSFIRSQVALLLGFHPSQQADRLLELVNPDRAKIIALGAAEALLFEPPRGIGSTLAEVLDACRDALHPSE